MLKQRMQILHQGNVISKQVRDFMLETIDVLEMRLPEVSEEKAVMFTTHLAMAAQRISEGNVVEGMDEAIWREIVSNANFEAADDFCTHIIARSDIIFPDSEKQFLILHICNLYE